MKATENTMQQIQRAIRKIAEKFPITDEAALMTDIHIRVSQDTGELLAFDDDDNEITRCVVEQWIENKDDDFYDSVAKDIRQCILQQNEMVENLSILKPYSFVLENDDCEHITELYVVDDDTVIIDPNLMEGLDEELDGFLAELLKN